MKTRIIKAIILGLAMVALFTGPTICSQRILVIANNSVSDDSLTRATISDIYMGVKTRWDNGDAIRVVMLKGGDTHDVFVEDVVGTTPANLKNFWKKVVFTGTGTPPKIFSSQADLVDYVANTRNAIGYVNGTTSLGRRVKVISVR